MRTRLRTAWKDTRYGKEGRECRAAARTGRCKVPVVGRCLMSKQRLNHGHVAQQGKEAGKEQGKVRLEREVAAGRLSPARTHEEFWL